MKKNKVVCIGEALIDRIRNKSSQGFTDFLGGAPANVACALRKLKIDSTFLGSLGNDDYGKKFITQFNKLDVNLDFLQLDDNRIDPVTKYFVSRKDFSKFKISFLINFLLRTSSAKYV